MGKARVVIVGSGDSARLVLSKLSGYSRAIRSRMHVTLIRPNTFCEVDYYVTYAITRPNEYHANTTTTPPHGADTVVHGVAVRTVDGVVTVKPVQALSGNGNGYISSAQLEQELEIPFDVLVAATGSTIPFVQPSPGQSFKSRLFEVESFVKLLTSQNQVHVVIGGGGTVGCELAGDVLEAMAEQQLNGNRAGKVTVVTRGSCLIADQNPSYSRRAHAQLTQMGAHIIYNNEVVSQQPQESDGSNNNKILLTLKDGTRLMCDRYLPAFGKGPNSEWLTTGAVVEGKATATTLPKNVVNARRQIIVDDYLQCPAYPKLFALGAVSTRPEPVLAPVIEFQAATVAHNLVAHLFSTTTKLKRRKFWMPVTPPPAPMYIKLGHAGHVMMVNDNFPSFVGTLVFEWCGFPCNLCVPCVTVGALLGILDPMMCGWCCDDGTHGGRGLAKTMMALKDLHVLSYKNGYRDLGSGMKCDTMER